LEILDRIQQKILSLFSTIPEHDSFYLTGGTALSAFYLHHRKSRDLDFFSDVEELIVPFTFRLEGVLQEEGLRTERKRELRSFVEIVVSSRDNSTIIHFGLDSPYRLEPLKDSVKFKGLKIDNLTDIGANKLLALFGRANLRDFIDVYFLLKDKFQKKELLDNAKRKDPGFDLYWFATALEMINEFPSDSPDMLFMLKPCTLDELQSFYNTWKRDIFKEITGDSLG